MAGAIEKLLSEADREAITAATRGAEGKTSGEIVPYVVVACDEYDDAAWKGAALGALAAAALSGLAHWITGSWGGAGLAWTTLPVAAGAAIGFVLADRVGLVTRWLVSDDTLELRARRRAMQAFLEEEVFSTRERTGILVFMAMLERKVVILADSGINARVRQDEWNDIVADLVEGIRKGTPADALVAAIHRCGELLERRGVEIRADDSDELTDRPRLRER